MDSEDESEEKKGNIFNKLIDKDINTEENNKLPQETPAPPPEPEDPNKIIKDLGFEFKFTDNDGDPIQPLESMRYNGSMNKNNESIPFSISWNHGDNRGEE